MATEDVTIVESADALTPTWLTEALHAAGRLDERTSVAAVEVAAVGTGQMCDSWRLTLTYEGQHDPEAPATLVAKLPANDPTSRATALALRSYENEVRFYQQLAPDLP